MPTFVPTICGVDCSVPGSQHFRNCHNAKDSGCQGTVKIDTGLRQEKGQ
jgi:hypothetical protein